MKRTVKVWDKPQEVEVYQVSKSVWSVVGTYMGKRIETKDRTESSALKRWSEAARYAGG